MNIDIFKDYWNITLDKKDYLSSLETLFYLTEQQVAVIETTDRITRITSTVAMSSMAPILLSGANPALIWCLLNLMQIFYYLLLINVEYPWNVKQFLGIFSMGRFQFLPNPVSWITPKLEEEAIETPYRFSQADMNSLFLLSAGETLLIWLLTLFFFLFFIWSCPTHG